MPEEDGLKAVHKIRLLESILGFLTMTARLLLWGWVAYQAKEAISALAGKATLADISLSILKSGSRELIAYAATLLALAWGVSERVLRKRKVKHLSARVKLLERRLDPNRSSSNLTATGDTRPGD